MLSPPFPQPSLRIVRPPLRILRMYVPIKKQSQRQQDHDAPCRDVRFSPNLAGNAVSPPAFDFDVQHAAAV